MEGRYVVDFIPRPGRTLYQRSIKEKTIVKLPKVKAIIKRIHSIILTAKHYILKSKNIVRKYDNSLFLSLMVRLFFSSIFYISQ